jgi:chemotaxis response regulator CheB
MEKSVRVVVANRPRLLRELVLLTLSKHAWLNIVGEAENEKDVPSLVAETKPDVLVIVMDELSRLPPLSDELLKKFPTLRIIGVAPNTNTGTVYWASLDIHAATIEGSEKALLEMMRSKAARTEVIAS